ncbi:MAG TPA: strawberry notch family protein [Pyrinomonadaceae bacterium]|nr:strawberry notch family protein [Pyrinomonadaceae bacterium]
MLHLNQTENGNENMPFDELLVGNQSNAEGNGAEPKPNIIQHQKDSPTKKFTSPFDGGDQSGDLGKPFEENLYGCAYLKGGATHPGVIVETAGLANIKPPRPTYRPKLPVEIIISGKISEIQLERIIYAGQAHAQKLPFSMARAGISIGDGTGVGKTGTILGIILDNWFSGRKKTIWFSVKFDLIKAVKDEMARLGINIPIKLINDYKPEEEITLSKGIVFCTYQSLIAKSKKGRRRLDQLTSWLGVEGMLIFDEGHRAKNFFADERRNGTQTGAAVAEIQDMVKFPDYRVVYSSATAATEVRHLAYMIRLGLWGQGSAFADFAEFAREIEEGGIGAMEMVARDLKAMGRYLCGSLSMGVDPESGLSVEYREVVHRLTAHQREMYDNMARAWQTVLQKTEKALTLTNSEKFLRRHIVNNFWAEHQRCTKAIITAFKVPTLISEIERALAEQHSIIISITSTGEASLTRQMARSADEEEAISDLDFSPRETLTRLIESCFPTALYQEITDEVTEKIKFEPLLGENGEQIHSKAALALKQELLDRLATLQLPEHPLDQIINHFGAENVAEMTGRKMRLVKLSNGDFAHRPRGIAGVPQRQTNLHELNSFQSKRKRIAIMSEVAATGDSLHSDKRAINQQRREHIAAELKWSADKQLQDFGRTHRSNQASPPIYLLVYTELGGEKRFSTSIARRLASTGALNKGDRRANQIGGLEKFNLESKEGRAALKIVYDRILGGFQLPGLANPRQTLSDMGLLTRSESGEESVSENEKQNIVRFFNRLLSLEVDRQNALFEYFYKIYTETVEHLKATGKYDLGLEDIKAISVKIRREPQIINRDQITGATTHLYELETIVPTHPARFEDLEREDAYFYRKLGLEEPEFVAARPSLIHTDPETGESYQTYAVSRPAGKNLFYTGETELAARYRLVARGKAKDWWNGEVEKIPPLVNKTVFLLSGALIPVWRQIKNVKDAAFKIVRTTTDEGVRLVGLQIPKAQVKEIVRLFDGVWEQEETSNEIFQSVLDGKESIELMENIRLKSSKFFGTFYVEIVPGRAEHPKKFRALGLTSLTQQSRERFLLPNNKEESIQLLQKLLTQFPPLSGTNQTVNLIDEKIFNQNENDKPNNTIEDLSPIDVREWLIEPDREEFDRIKAWDLLNSD